MPTPDIDIGELRKLEKAAHGLGYPHHARSRFREKLECAAPALLAAAEEGERLRAENASVVRRLAQVTAMLGVVLEIAEHQKVTGEALLIIQRARSALSTYEGKSE